MSRKWWNILSFLLAIMLMLILFPLAYADVRNAPKDIDINSHNVKNVNKTYSQEHNVNIENPANTTADIKLKNTPDNVMVTPGSGDSCKAHIGANLSIPGLGAGLTIPLPGRECRKLIYYDRMMDAGRYDVAAKIFCDLKEVYLSFDKDESACEAAVLFVPEIVKPIIVADNTEYVEKVEQAQVQQQVVIEQQDEELKELEQRVEKALEERDQRDAAKAKSEAYFKAILAGKEE